jgi:hypothetical protein
MSVAATQDDATLSTTTQDDATQSTTTQDESTITNQDESTITTQDESTTTQPALMVVDAVTPEQIRQIAANYSDQLGEASTNFGYADLPPFFRTAAEACSTAPSPLPQQMQQAIYRVLPECLKEVRRIVEDTLPPLATAFDPTSFLEDMKASVKQMPIVNVNSGRDTVAQPRQKRKADVSQQPRRDTIRRCPGINQPRTGINNLFARSDELLGAITQQHARWKKAANDLGVATEHFRKATERLTQ